MSTDRLISYAEVLECFGIPPHAQAGFLVAGATGVSEKTIRRMLSGETYPRATTAARIQTAAMQAYSRLIGLSDAGLTESRANEIRASNEYAWISKFEEAVSEFVRREQEEGGPTSTSKSATRPKSPPEQLLERVRITLLLLAGFELASSKRRDTINLYWPDLLPSRDERSPERVRMPMKRWFDQITVQFERGSLFVGVRSSEQGAPVSLFDLARRFSGLPNDPQALPEAERKRIAAQFQPAAVRRIHRTRLPYAVVERELGLAPRQASRWANATRAIDLPGWKALLLINQRMSRLMPPALIKAGPNLPVDLLVARFLHAFCLDCVARGGNTQMLEAMEAWYVESAERWARYFKGGEETGGQSPLLAAFPPSR